MYPSERALQKKLVFLFVIIFNKILKADFTVGDSINSRDWIKIRINKTGEKAKAIYYRYTKETSLQLLEMIDHFFPTGPEGQSIWMTLEKGNTLSLKLKIHRRERLDSES